MRISYFQAATPTVNFFAVSLSYFMTNHLGDNLQRLAGLHALTTRETSRLTGISAQALSELQSGKRSQPRLTTVRSIADLFEISMDRLLESPFEELLSTELAEPERFRRVEDKIPRSSRTV